MVLEQRAEHESEWAAISSIGSKLGCTPETLRKWVRQAERDGGKRPGVTTAERERMRQKGQMISSCTGYWEHDHLLEDESGVRSIISLLFY